MKLSPVTVTLPNSTVKELYTLAIRIYTIKETMVLSIRKGVEFFNSKIHSLITFFFYLILIGVSIQSWSNLMEESTTFDERFVENKERFPSFTLCPNDNDDNKKSIESFEDIEKGIELVRQKYRIEYLEYKPFEQDKKYEAFYNDTSYGTLYFAPQIKMKPPFEAVVCLIWTPSRKHKIKPDWSYKVSERKCIST